MEKIEEIRIGEDHYEPLMLLELQQYRKYTGKLSWLAQGTRLDLSYMTFQISMRNTTAIIADLHNVIRVLKKVDITESGISYGYIGKKDDLRIIGIGE